MKSSVNTPFCFWFSLSKTAAIIHIMAVSLSAVYRILWPFHSSSKVYLNSIEESECIYSVFGITSSSSQYCIVKPNTL